MNVFNQTRNKSLITNARLADTFWLRFWGLLRSAPLQKGEGLILVGEKSIHTLFMGFSIDVLYVDSQYKVICTDIDMTPYKLGSYVRQSAYILEMPVGTIADTDTQTGDQLIFE